MTTHQHNGTAFSASNETVQRAKCELMPSIYLSASLNVDPDRRPGLEAALPELLAACIKLRGGTLYADQGELRWRRPIAMLSIDEHALSFDRMYLTLPPSNVIAASRIRTTSHDLPQYPGTDSAITQSDTIDMQPLRARLPGSADSSCTASQQMSLSLDERIFASPNDPLRTDAETCFFRVSALGDGGAFSLAGSSITLGTATARTDDGGEVDFALTCKTNSTAHAGSTVFQAIDRYLCGDYSAYEKTSDAQNVEVPGEGPYAPACVCPADLYLQVVDEGAEPTLEPAPPMSFEQLPRRTGTTPSRPMPEALTP